VRLLVSAPSGNTFLSGLPLAGAQQITVAAPGIAIVSLVASINLGGENRDTFSHSIVTVAA